MSPLLSSLSASSPSNFPNYLIIKLYGPAPSDPFWSVLRPQLRGPRMMAILASGRQLTRAVAHLGDSGFNC